MVDARTSVRQARIAMRGEADQGWYANAVIEGHTIALPDEVR
jgi:hypothetical protein